MHFIITFILLVTECELIFKKHSGQQQQIIFTLLLHVGSNVFYNNLHLIINMCTQNSKYQIKML
jgi:hypothetical protein